MGKRVWLPSLLACALLLGAGAWAQEAPAPAAAAPEEAKGVQVGTYPQQVSRQYTTKTGLSSDDVLSVTVLGSGKVVVGTRDGVGVFSDGTWEIIPESSGFSVPLLAAAGDAWLALAEGTLYRVTDGDISDEGYAPSDAGEFHALAAEGDRVFLGADKGLYELKGSSFSAVAELNERLEGKAVRQVALGPEGRVAVAAEAGLFELGPEGWQALYPQEGPRSWAPRDVRGTAYDSQGRLWFASPQGAGVRGAEGWTLYTGQEGLPYNDFTSMAASPDGSVWFGTKIGAIRFDGKNWEYREGKRWLPGNEVRDVAVDSKGGAWFATDAGAGLIEAVPMTLAEKAKQFEDAIDKYHRRTPYEYVLEAHLPKPGDLSEWRNGDSDNDGLWTSMYGAGECFAYGATKDADYKERAQKAFKALKFLMDVTQGGTPPAQPGFVARTVLPTSGPNPNEKDYTAEKDREKQKEDKLWKVLEPRWGTSADGQWYWKADTSSDELDGHYSFYAAYYDLVCETEAEKEEVRKVVVALTDHLLRNNYQLIDHDGQATRWAVYNPERFNQDPWWAMERGLNSLSMLSYLVTAHHMTADSKYMDAVQELMDKHGYHINMLVPKVQNGPGSGNQSDDEMAFMSYYNLLKYSTPDEFTQDLTFSFYSAWANEQPEMNPFFNFAYAAHGLDAEYTSPWSTTSIAPWKGWLEDSIQTLKNFPLDRCNWESKNSHRLDIMLLPRQQAVELTEENRPRYGYRVNGKVIPVENRHFNHWNSNPWSLDYGGDGRQLASGTVYLLPYYMGLYHGFIKEK